VLVIGVLGAVALAGCGSGQGAATSLTRPSIPGVSADAAGIQVRNAVVPFDPEGYQQGGDAPVEFAIANAGEEPVRLVGLSSEGAASATVTSATPIGAPAPAPAASPEPTSAPAGEAGAPLEVAPGEFIAVTLQLTGLRQPLNGTASIPVTLSFDNGVELPLAIPMATPLDPLPPATPVVEPAEH
jgi:copper(I)-binding protein